MLRRGLFEKWSGSSTITRLIKNIWSAEANFVETLTFGAKLFVYASRTKPRKVSVFKFLTVAVYIFTNLLPWGSVQTRSIKQNKEGKHSLRWPVNQPSRFFRRKYLKPPLLPQNKLTLLSLKHLLNLVNFYWLTNPARLSYVFIYANSPGLSGILPDIEAISALPYGWPKTTR